MLRRDTTFGPSIDIAGVPFVVSSFDAAVGRLLESVRRPAALALRFSNAYSVSIATKDPAYRAVLAENGLTFPDGAPVAWTMRRLAARAGIDPAEVELIRGPSFFNATLERSADQDVRHYFLGAVPDTIDRLVENVRATWPGVVIAGAHAPVFGPVDEAFVADAAERVASSGANLLWVALGTPKQDFATSLLAARLQIPAAAVGAAFDFTAGTVRQAPPLLRGRGLEWLYRLSQDPKRLWRRYTIGNLVFLRAALRALRA